MNTNAIENCDEKLLEEQKKHLKEEIIHGENAGHFAVFDIEAGCRKTRTAEEGLVELYRNGGKAIFVRRTDDDCRESMKNINGMAKEKIAFSYNNEDVPVSNAHKINRILADIPIVIITHQKYKVLMKNNEKRKLFSKGRTTLIIDEFMSTVHTISLGESDIKTYKALLKNDYVLLQAFEKAMHQPIDFLITWNKENPERRFVTMTDTSPTKDFNTLIKLINSNITDEMLTLWKYKLIQTIDQNSGINYSLLDVIISVKILCEKLLEYKQLFVSMCLYCDKKLYTTDKRYNYWFLNNNIMLDASGELQSAYSLNYDAFSLEHCAKVLNHSKWKIINVPITTTTATKNRIINFYDILNAELKKYGNEILVVGKKDEMHLIDVPEENKGYFGNITGSNQWYDKKNVAIIQTHNLSDVDYILKYLHYAKAEIDKDFVLTSKCNGRAGKMIYSFKDARLEKIRVHWIASEIYQAVKRVNRNMKYDTDVLIFINNTDVIDLLKAQMVGCRVEVVDYENDQFVIEKSSQDEYVENLKKNSYASKFIDFLADIQNGLHSQYLDSNNRISKVKAREFLGLKTSGNFSNKVLNKTEVISYCKARNIDLSGQYIKLPNVG